MGGYRWVANGTNSCFVREWAVRKTALFILHIPHLALADLQKTPHTRSPHGCRAGYVKPAPKNANPVDPARPVLARIDVDSSAERA